MKKQEYVSPEMDIVEINVKSSILAGSETDEKGPGTDWGDGGSGETD